MTQRRVPEKSSQQFSISGNKGLEASLVALDQYKLGGTKRGIYAGTMQYLNTLNRAFNYSTVQTGVTSYKLSDVLKLSQTGSYTASSGVPYNFVVDRGARVQPYPGSERHDQRVADRGGLHCCGNGAVVLGY